MSTTIYEIAGTLTALAPLHVGADANGNTVDLVQFVDGQGRVAIPGSSLAGALRSAVGPRQCWGSQESASPVTVFDAPAFGTPPLTVRKSVAIDRQRGTAADDHLYSRELIPAGTAFRARLIVETRSGYDADEARADVGDIVSVLSGSGFHLGGATSRGLGRLQLTDYRVTERVLDRENLLAALFDGREVQVGAAESASIPPGVLRITIPWQPAGPVMSKVELDGGVADSRPLTDAADSQVRMLIPGSSVKGVFRSHAERIARTAAGFDVPSAFAEQVKAGGVSAVGDLFGLAGDEQDEAQPGRRGVLTVHEVRSSVAVPAADWERICLAAESVGPTLPEDRHSTQRGAASQANMRALAREVDAFNDNHHAAGLWLDVVMRNSLDRWTGGAATGRLFSTVEAHARWDDIVLDLDVARLRRLARKNPQQIDAAIALLLFVVIDACEGWLALGHSTTRGLGAFTADPATVTFTAADSLDADDDNVSALLTHQTLAAILAEPILLEDLSRSWQAVIAAAQATHDNTREASNA